MYIDMQASPNTETKFLSLCYGWQDTEHVTAKGEEDETESGYTDKCCKMLSACHVYT